MKHRVPGLKETSRSSADDVPEGCFWFESTEPSTAGVLRSRSTSFTLPFLGLILIIVVGTLRLIGSSSNTCFPT